MPGTDPRTALPVSSSDAQACEKKSISPDSMSTNVSLTSGKYEPEESLKESDDLTDGNHDASKVVLTHLESSGALSIGPMEQAYDVERVVTRPDHSSHEDDPWKYGLDEETKLRIVQFVPEDPENPKTQSKARKWYLTVVLGLVCFMVALGSAIVTGDLERPAEHFGVSMEVIILASVSVYVLGFGVGPLVFAPVSEEIGRQPVYIVTLAIATIFIVPCALSKNIGTLLICRLLSGIFFSAPMCLIGGSLADIWEASERGKAMSVFSAAPFLGPVMGPIFGGLLADHADSWRWLYYTFLIIAGAVYILFVTTTKETHHGTILKKRAKMLRKVTGDSSYKALCEVKARTFKEVASSSLLRPFLLLSEVIVFLITIYMSVLYGLLYMFFFAYPIVYQSGKGWSASKTGIMFIPIGVGVLIACAVSPLINSDYNKRAQPYRDRGELPPPELRLIPMMMGCWFVPAGLFAFAWSSYPSVSWAGPCFSGLGCGFGFLCLYNPANNYIIDSYQHYAASGLAAKTFIRSIWGACVPLFTIQMYDRLGYQWATSLMAFISLACCLIPFLFYKYGAKIREYSKYAYSGDS